MSEHPNQEFINFIAQEGISQLYRTLGRYFWLDLLTDSQLREIERNILPVWKEYIERFPIGTRTK